MTYVKPSDKMIKYACSLVVEREYPEWGATGQERLNTFHEKLNAKLVDKFQLMGIIDYLQVAPLDTESGLPVGVYQRNGEIFVVKLNRRKTNKYVTRLVELNGGRRLNAEDEHVPIDFVYAPGVLAQLRPADQMTIEEAKHFIIRYGRCLFCGQFLKAAKSVERSVGPVCYKRYAGTETREPEVTKEQASDWLAALGG